MKTEQWQWSAEKGWDGRMPSATTELGTSAQVVFLFGGMHDIEVGKCFDIVRAAYPNAHIFGCTTGGEFRGPRATDCTVVITAVAFENTEVVVSHVQIAGIERSFEAGEDLVRSLDAHHLRHVFVLSEALLVNGSDLVRGINSALPHNVTVSGGFAGDNDRLQETFTWYDGKPERSTVVALAFYGDRLQVGLAVSAGWDAFGTDRLITKSKGNVLYELDGRSALGLYKEYLGEYAENRRINGALFSLALRVGASENRVIRTQLAIDEEEQSITFAGNMPEGSYVRLMRGHIENLIEGAQEAATASIEKLGSAHAQFSLVVSCSARRAALKQRIDEEIEVVDAALGDQVAMTGFYSLGEIAPVVAGGQSELHNQTMIITSFAEV